MIASFRMRGNVIESLHALALLLTKLTVFSSYPNSFIPVFTLLSELF